MTICALLSYQNVNLVLDEIELYYHPDLPANLFGLLIEYVGSRTI